MPSRPGPAPAQSSPSLRERFRAMRNVPPFLRMIWKTSPGLTLLSLGLRLIRSLLPLAMLYVGKLIIDEAVRLAGLPGTFPPLEQAISSGLLSPLLGLLALELGLAVAADLLGRLVSYADGLLSELFTNASSIRLMEHAAELDLEDFEDADVQDKLDRARRQTMGRMNLMSQLFGQAAGRDHRGQPGRWPGGVCAVADRAAGRGPGAGLHRRVALQRAGLLAQLPVDARAPPARIPAPDRRQRRERQGGEDLQPPSVPDRALPHAGNEVLPGQPLAGPPACGLGHPAGRARHAGLLRRLCLHRLAHGAR
jgi:hypothetical protein